MTLAWLLIVLEVDKKHEIKLQTKKKNTGEKKNAVQITSAGVKYANNQKQIIKQQNVERQEERKRVMQSVAIATSCDNSWKNAE